MIQRTLIDNGFYQISEADAKKLNHGALPRSGMEALVEEEGKYYWLSRTVVNRKQVWSIRDSGGWILENGIAVLKAQN